MTSAALSLAWVMPAAETHAVRQAREQVELMRRLAEAGAASKKQLEQSEEALRDAQEDTTVAEALDARANADEVTEEQAQDAARAARRRLEREKTRLAVQAKLVAAGVAPRTSLVPFEENVEYARRMVDAADMRTRELAEIAAMIRAEQDASEQAPSPPTLADGAIGRITRFHGEAKFGQDEFRQVVLEFERKFDRKLPVSARGETALHRSMGFNHSGRVDVALAPDGQEGRWLMRYLEQKQIPFFAFRTAVPGQATAAHIHIGPPSTRYRVSD